MTRSTSTYDIAIVGAGHGGAQAAIALRQLGCGGSIALIGDEPDPPYERPPLSKEYLAGDKTFDRMLIRPLAFWNDRDVALRTATRIVRVDAGAHVLTTAEGERIGYRTLIWAAGGSPRRLTCRGGDLAGVHSIRTRGDVDRLASELPAVRRVVVIGGGYIGLEAAAVLRKFGKQVTVIEAMDRVLARVAGHELSRFYADEHRAHGVDIRLAQSVAAIEGDTRVTGVRLADGSVVPADLAIVGIGVTPAVGPLTEAGAKGASGVFVDAQCRTSLDDVYAIGDCAEHENRFARGARIRLESVQNANDMATCAARAIAGTPAPYDALPWFWSNQYDLKLQTVGLSAGHNATIVRGRPGDRAFSLIYLRDGAVIALDCVNRVKDYVQGRALILSGAVVDPAQLADPERSLKDIALAAAG